MRILAITACSLALCFTGCVLVPVGSKVSSGYSPSSETLAFLKLPGTTQADVVENLGPPLYESASTHTFVYVWEEMPRFILVTPKRASVDYGAPEECALLIAFDAAGHVLDYGERYIDTTSLEDECADWHRTRAKKIVPKSR